MQEDINITLKRFNHEINVREWKIQFLPCLAFFIVFLPAILVVFISDSFTDVIAVKVLLFILVIAVMGRLYVIILKELEAELRFWSGELEKLRRR